MPRCRPSVNHPVNAVAHVHRLHTRPRHWWATQDWSISKMPPIRTCTSPAIYIRKPIVACIRNRISIQRRKSISPKIAWVATHWIQMWQCRTRHSERFEKIAWNCCEINNSALVLARTRTAAPVVPMFRQPKINRTNRSSFMWRLAKLIHHRSTNNVACIGCKCLPTQAIIVFMKIIGRMSIRMWFMRLREIEVWLVAWTRTIASMMYKCVVKTECADGTQAVQWCFKANPKYKINKYLPILHNKMHTRMISVNWIKYA